MNLDELKIYKLSMKLGDEVWEITSRWNFYTKETIGKQLVRAADSIAANISEGYGRFHYKENKHFNFIARGSLFETKTWLEKAASRGLIEASMFEILKKEMNDLGRMLNSYIKKIGNVDVAQDADVRYGKNQIKSDWDGISADELPFPDIE